MKKEYTVPSLTVIVVDEIETGNDSYIPVNFEDDGNTAL